MGNVKTQYYAYGQDEVDYLISVDQTLGAAITRLGRVDREVIPDLFTALIHAIVGQLISVKAVQTIWERMQTQLGAITPSNLAKHTADEIQKCGITMKKALYIQAIAQAIESGAFCLVDLNSLSDSEVIKKLMTLNGVGKHNLNNTDLVIHL